jgi:ribosomal protein S18 acetylase RimI-like enzyme
MKINFREGNFADLEGLKDVAIKSWLTFQTSLTKENWEKLEKSLKDDHTYIDLLDKSNCILCTDAEKITGMAFLVPSGNPTEIYPADWSYIRLVSVDPDYQGKGIGRALTKKCLSLARSNGENVVALHTSELMENARHLYESLGFQIIRELDQRLGKRYWLYTMDLNK